MRLENERPSQNVEDERGQGGGFGSPPGGVIPSRSAGLAAAA